MRTRWLLEKGDYAQALESAESLTDRASVLGAVRSQGLGQLYRAIALYGLGRVEPATEAVDSARDLLERVEDPVLEAHALDWAAILFGERGQPEVAQLLHGRVRELYDALPEQHEESAAVLKALAILHQGTAAHRQGRLDEAQNLIQESFDQLQKVGSARQIANAAVNLGVIHHTLGDLPPAIELYAQAVTLADEADHRFLKATAMVNWGEALADSDKHAEALSLYPQAVVIFQEEEKGGASWQSYSQLLKARSHLALGDRESTRAAYQEAQRLALGSEPPDTATAEQAQAGIDALESG